MNFRPLILGMLLTLPLRGGATALRDIAPYRQGMEALDSELWDIADKRFEQALQTPGISAPDRRLVELKRIEAWIRGDQPSLALARLGEAAFANDPEAYFWKAQALAGLGRYSEAVTLLAGAMDNQKAVFRNEALLTRSSLQLALDDQDGARLTLEALAKSGDPKVLKLVHLRQAAILIDQGKFAEARKLLPDAKSLEVSDRPERAYLDARLLLAEGKADDAASAFAILKDQAEGQSLTRYHAAIIGLAEATAASGAPDAADDAIKTLLDEVATRKDSPLLDAIFNRVLRWLPEQPAPNDPTLARIAEWIPPLKHDGMIAGDWEKDKAKDRSGAKTAFPTAPLSHPDELAPFAMYAEAMGLHREATPEAKAQSYGLLTRLRWEFPSHFLAGRALLQLGRWHLEDGRTARAFATLDAIRQSSGIPGLRGEAAFVEARAEFEQGHREAAAALFDQAGSLLPNPAADAAALNAALSRLQAGSVLAVPHSGNAERDARIRADLELERALALENPDASVEALGHFITAYPDHPRNAEARICAAVSALQAHPPDPVFAREQADTIAATPALKDSIRPEELAWLRLQISDQADTPVVAIHLARVYLSTYPDGAHAADASMRLGRNLFRNGDYHDARLELEKLAAAAPNGPLAPAALILAARAAALGATEQSREESLAIFDRVAKGSSALAPLAKLERAHLLITLKRFDTTIEELQPWFQSMKTGEALKVPAGLLLGQALYAQGGDKPGSLAAALAIYDQLLVAAKDQPAVIHRLHYLRGLVLEQLPHPTIPGATREGDALESYISVLQAADDHPPAEWEWFERCGFRALQLKEDAARAAPPSRAPGIWRSAVKIAAKIASFKGPRAEEAAERAKGLRLEHMIWEE